MSEIKINTNTSSYSVFIESESFETFRKKILPNDENYLVVISQKIEKLYGKVLNIPKSNKFVLKDGEKEKNFENYKKILGRALKMKLTRQCSFIAIGGGVVGDLTGFAASTYMRGVKFIQVPTTLLACVDSSVGGKTAINTKFGKNLIGSFYQPSVVYINPKFLDTLDEKQFKSGLGEVIKYGFIEKNCLADFNFANYLSENSDKILSKDAKTLEYIIETCVKIKKSVVERDEKENDLRRILNFGHTYGHAIECITNYKKYTHGQSVIEGIRFAIELAVKNGLTDESYKHFAYDLINKFGYKKLPDFNKNRVKEIIKSDKKANSKNFVFVLPTEYAMVKIVEIEPEKLF